MRPAAVKWTWGSHLIQSRSYGTDTSGNSLEFQPVELFLKHIWWPTWSEPSDTLVCSNICSAMWATFLEWLQGLKFYTQGQWFSVGQVDLWHWQDKSSGLVIFNKYQLNNKYLTVKNLAQKQMFQCWHWVLKIPSKFYWVILDMPQKTDEIKLYEYVSKDSVIFVHFYSRYKQFWVQSTVWAT